MGRSEMVLCRNSDVSSEQALGRFHAFDDNASRERAKLRVLLGGQLAAGEDHDGNRRQALRIHACG